MAKRTRRNVALLKEGADFDFTPELESIVRELHTYLASPPVLVFPD